MKALFRTFLLAAVIAGSLFAVGPAPANADDYWNGYWGWYDSTYRPYYSRRYAYSGPGYGYYAPNYAPAPAYGYTYGPGYYGYGYNSYAPLGGAYYGVPGAGVGVYPGGAAVRVGPARLGWR
jgi:hypothetical protein